MVLLAIIASIFIVAGVGGFIIGILEDDFAVGFLGGAAVTAGLMLVFALTQTPKCDTIKVQSSTITLKGKKYEFSKVRVCDNGKFRIKGHEIDPKQQEKLPEVTVN